MHPGIRSRGAAALVILASACGGGDKGGGGTNTGPEAVSRVVVTPSQVTVEVGGTSQLSAQARSAAGTVLTGRPVTWTSSNTAIAQVSSSGLVSGVAPGSATISASVEGRSGSAAAQVTSPPVTDVQIAPNPGSVEAGLTVQLTATAKDAHGAVVTGKSFAWMTSDASIATVNGSGLVLGVASGNVTISASVDGVTGTTPVSVTPAVPVVITQITPATLVEGQPAQITGSGFSATAASNGVLIDGVAAMVTQATTTSLQIVVPASDCKPARTAPVRIMIGLKNSNVVNHPTAPATPVTLAVGQMALIQSPADRCLQFAAMAGSERYVVGVQSVSEVATTLTPVTVGGAIPSGAHEAPPLLPVPVASAEPPPPLRPADRASLDRWQHHIAVTAAAYERENARLQPIADRLGAQYASMQAAVPTVPGTVMKGGKLSIRFPSFTGNSCTDFTDLPVTVREISPRLILLEDDANPEMLAQSVVDQMVAAFATIYDIDVDQFGAVGDFDGNQRIVIVVSKEVNRIGTSAPLAFVPVSSLLPVTQCVASNEGEFFIMRAADATGQFGAGVYTAATQANDVSELLLHEFAHIIQASRRLAAGGSFMASWLAEGLAVAAQEVGGFQILGLGDGGNYGPAIVYTTFGADARNFFGYMGDLLAYFGFDFNGGKIAGTPEQCTWVGNTTATGHPGPCAFSIRLLYGVSWSVIKNAIDRHLGGAANQKQYLRAFSDYTGTPGFAALQTVLGLPMATIMAEWMPVLYIDDRYPAAAAFQLANWNLRAIAGAWANPNADLIPRMRGFGQFSDNLTLRGGSAALYEISGANRPATALRFRDGTGNALPAFVTVFIVRVQ